ncbi:hypothetical protein ACO2Q2_15390 [Dyella sp. KRB-257]|uniref:hypothetical protein n=1 Tax=Dyella sp. KRB-257 TaxID=3400915 RepID=UPI003BFCC241
MKLHLLAALPVTFIAGCSQRPLTEAECQTLADKEIEFALSKAPAEEVEDLRAFLSSVAEGGTARCMAGETYRRSDYRCMVKADDANEIGECVNKVSRRLGHG